MKKTFLVLSLVALVLGFGVKKLFAQTQVPAASDWTWTFTEARDYDGNLLGQITGPTDQPLVFSTTSTNYAVFLYGTLYANQELNSSNIYFAGGGFNYEGLGQGNSGFHQSYSDSIVQSGQMNELLPVSAGGSKNFWVFSAYNLDNDAVPGEYRVFDCSHNIYDPQEPLDQWNQRIYHSVYVTNAAKWTVTPEPVSSVLFLLGAGALAGVRKLRGKA
jgi:hypothetical protein